MEDPFISFLPDLPESEARKELPNVCKNKIFVGERIPIFYCVADVAPVLV